MTIHVLPGDAQVEEFAKTELEGQVVVCREALVDGDVRAANLDEFWNVRAAYLNDAYPENDSDYLTTVAAELERLRNVTAYTEVNLWFEYELFCHVNLWFCVWLLKDTKAELYRVAPVLQSKEHPWDGFGGMTAEDLRECFDARIKFTDSDVAFGAELWSAYQNRDYRKLEELSTTQSPCFPYLKEACEAEIQKSTRPKQVLRDIRDDGVEDFGEMFAAFRARAGVYGFGDSQVRRMLGEI